MTYFIAEYSFRPDPQTEMINHIGTSSSSQKTKKSSRSRERKYPEYARFEEQQPGKIFADP